MELGCHVRLKRHYRAQEQRLGAVSRVAFYLLDRGYGLKL